VLVIGIFVVRRTQALNSVYRFDSNSNYNANENSNRSSSANYNSNASDEPSPSSNDNSSTNSSSDNTGSSSASSDMSEQDRYRLFYAAAKSGDPVLQQRAARKIGIVDSSGMPTSTYGDFTKGMINWAVTDRAWVQTMNTPSECRAYALERLDATP